MMLDFTIWLCLNSSWWKQRPWWNGRITNLFIIRSEDYTGAARFWSIWSIKMTKVAKTEILDNKGGYSKTEEKSGLCWITNMTGAAIREKRYGRSDPAGGQHDVPKTGPLFQVVASGQPQWIKCGVWFFLTDGQKVIKKRDLLSVF